MKPTVAAIVICAFAFAGTAAIAGDTQKRVPTEDHAIGRLGLLLDTPRTPVGQIYGPSTQRA